MLISSDTLERHAAHAAYALDRAGVQVGEAVALVGGPSLPLLAALVGAWRLGAVAVPLAPDEPEAARAQKLALVRPRLVLSSDSLAAQTLPPGARAMPFPEVGEAPFLPDAMPDVAPALLVFTSGSTGAPKAAQLSHGALRASARGVATALGFGAASAWLLALPLHHVGGLGVVVRALVARGGLVLPDASGAAGLAAMLSDPAATHASLVGTQLYRLLRDAPEVLATRTLLLGGSALAPRLLDAADARGLHVATSYGLTEMASTVTATAPGAARDALATSGRLLPGRELHVSQDGELFVRGPTRFDGYLTDAPVRPVYGRGLVEPFDAAGWFATGDLGHFDVAGRLVVTGRRGLMFVSGGENVQPEAIERALLALPGVVQAVAVPVDDAEFGQRAVAFVETDGPFEPERLRDALRERLPRAFVPRAILPLPATPGLKPGRAFLARRAAAWAASGQP